MKLKELNAVIATLSRLRQTQGLESAQAQEFDKALHEFNALQKGGKIAKRRVVRVVAIVSKIVCEQCIKRQK